MTSIAAGSGHHSHAHDAGGLLSAENVTLPAGGGRGKGIAFSGLGLLLVVGSLGLSMAGVAGMDLRHWLAMYLVGAMSVLAMCLGSMFFVLAFHLTNAGWASTIRRQFENVASFTPLAALLVFPVLLVEIVTHGKMFLWLSPEMAHDEVLGRKAVYFYLNQPVGGFPLFWVIRAVVYVSVWTLLSRRLASLSRAQDATGDVALSARARFMSAWGILVFALTTAFAAFDWLMSLDFKFFSTMWGVYYFAGSAFAASALVAFILARLRGAGKLEGVVTQEHFHDLGKLMFSFTVFWAYISFFQYFLIWYSNIPEETAFFVYRNNQPWQGIGVLLMIGHFAAPFLILLFRKVKQSASLLTVMALWAMFIHVVDIYWIVRPMVDARLEHPSPLLSTLWLDAAAILGVVGLFAGYLCIKIPKSPLVALKDPYMRESLEHRNWV